jgi:glycosyltransferase involved in cell wall biosynthesis
MNYAEREDIKVSVCMITYNHEKFIESAIKSVVTQDANFKFELVIGEDCSNDKTLAICLEMQKQYPDMIRILSHRKNQGMMHNFVETFNACRGEYIAILEGDDTWAISNKLQLQTDFLDQNPDFTACFTGTVAFFDDTGQTAYHIPPEEFRKSELVIEQLIRRNVIAACSITFRKDLITFPEWYFSLPFGDWPIYISLAEKGKIGYIDIDAANYRLHQGGNYSRRTSIKNLSDDILFYRVIDKYIITKHHLLILYLIIRKSLRIVKLYIQKILAGNGTKKASRTISE